VANRRLTFSRSLYLPEAIQAAATAYSQVAAIDIRSDEHEIEVLIDADDRYGERVFDGFSNHALFETIVKTREQLGGTLT
jgi:hypothetical protein